MASRLLLQTLSAKQGADSDVHRWLAPLATAVALALGAWVATDWFWYFKGAQHLSAAPAPAPAQQPDARKLSESIAASSLFGTARTQVVAQSTANVKLKGIIASGPAGTSAAIVNTGARDEVVNVGNDVAPGFVLEAVYPTHVLVKHDGRLERVDIEERQSGSGAQLGLAVPPRSRGTLITPSPAPQANQPGLLRQNGLRRPASPLGENDPANASTGRLSMTAAGPTVEEAPPGSLLARIGLQQGDVIKSINGQPVNPTRDMVRLFQIASTGQTVQGEVMRGGQVISMRIGMPH